MADIKNNKDLGIKDEILKISEDLIQFKTVNSNDKEFEKAFTYVKRYFSDTDLEIFEHESNSFQSIVIATNEDPDIMLHGHIDVVEADEPMFEPYVKNGKLYGRGASDMKSGVAALMKVLKDTTNQEISIGLMLVSDEELGGFNGVKYLIDEGLYNPEFVISAEPNNTEGYLKIITEQKGVVRATISADGKNAHGSRPWNGENAAEKLWDAYSKLKGNFSTSKDEWGTTVNLGNFKSEGAVNVVPDKAEAELDIRYTKSYTPEEIEEDMSDIESLNFEIKSVDPMLDTNSENKFVQSLKNASEDVLDQDVCITKKEPASDVRHFSKVGVPGVVFGPEGYNVHEDGEYAVISSFEDYYYSLAKFIEKLT